jgi:uncharacterized protein (DUF983 family)
MGFVRVHESNSARPATPRSWWRTLWAVVRQRCPRCRRGRIFRGVLAMNDACPACGLDFKGQEGDFLCAMYISYALAVAIVCPLYFAIAALLPTWDTYLIALVTSVLYLPLSPAVFRSSRVVWIYLDRALDPHGTLTGSYEGSRRQQRASDPSENGDEDGPL